MIVEVEPYLIYEALLILIVYRYLKTFIIMEIKKDKTGRCIGKYFHKAPGIKCSHTRKQAIKDISSECGDGEFYSRAYIDIESIVLRACECEMHIYNINTNLL